jgi:pyrroline-5-carboxylate reductase
MDKKTIGFIGGGRVTRIILEGLKRFIRKSFHLSTKK